MITLPTDRLVGLPNICFWNSHGDHAQSPRSETAEEITFLLNAIGLGASNNEGIPEVMSEYALWDDQESMVSISI